MTIPKRTKALWCILLTMVAGLASRKIHAIPAATGDACYAVLMFFLVRFMLIRKSSLFVAACSLLLCFAIECSQLYQAAWIRSVRATLPGRLVLGQGFLWTDLVAYTCGTLMAWLLEKLVRTCP